MNAELVKIRDNLVCGHCECKFVGSDSQARKVKYEACIVYCSSTCRHAMMRKKFSTPAPNRGPCKHCKKEFYSRTAKIYCSMKCYTSSEQFHRHAESIHKKSLGLQSRAKQCLTARKGKDVPCLECGEIFYQKRKTKTTKPKKFCNRTCYRAYFAKRFDRWVANPEKMALPQCYDEFLDKQELSCVVEDCSWRGVHLTMHMNTTHGVSADEFKRATGFNLSTGVIARPLAETLRDRALVGVGLNQFPLKESLDLAHAAQAANPIRYRGKEASEHAVKSRALSLQEVGPERECLGCGVTFNQSSIFGRTLYCSFSCRDEAYKVVRDARAGTKKTYTRNPNGTFICK